MISALVHFGYCECCNLQQRMNLIMFLYAVLNTVQLSYPKCMLVTFGKQKLITLKRLTLVQCCHYSEPIKFNFLIWSKGSRVDM